MVDGTKNGVSEQHANSSCLVVYSLRKGMNPLLAELKSIP